MKRILDIVDGTKRGAVPCARLAYDPEAESFAISLDSSTNPDEMPFLFAIFAEQGVFEIDADWSLRWVEERIVPVDRQNLGQVLRANGLDWYDPYALLVASGGESANDNFVVREPCPETLASDETAGVVPRRPSPAARRQTRSETARAVQAARESTGIKQFDLADRCGMNQAAVSRIESGAANPTLDTLADLASGMGKRLRITFEDAS
jgi:DNA-binding XRE family transcriptional regulator